MKFKHAVIFLALLIQLPLSANLYSQQSAPKQMEQTDSDYPSPYFDEARKLEDLGDSRFVQEFFKMLGTLALLIGFLFVVLWLVKRLVSARESQVNVSSNIKIIESRAISQRTSIYVIDVFGEAFAIADSANGATLLGDLGSTEEESMKKFKDVFDKTQ